MQWVGVDDVDVDDADDYSLPRHDPDIRSTYAESLFVPCTKGNPFSGINTLPSACRIGVVTPRSGSSPAPSQKSQMQNAKRKNGAVCHLAYAKRPGVPWHLFSYDTAEHRWSYDMQGVIVFMPQCMKISRWHQTLITALHDLYCPTYGTTASSEGASM